MQQITYWKVMQKCVQLLGKERMIMVQNLKERKPMIEQKNIFTNGELKRTMSRLNETDWYLVNDDTEEIILESNEILDVIEKRKELDRDATRITDREETQYDTRDTAFERLM